MTKLILLAASALAAATPYQTLFATTLGGLALVRLALVDANTSEGEKRVATARFFAEQIVTEVPALARTVTEGASALSGIDRVLLGS